MGSESSSLQRAADDADGPLESQPHVAFLVDGRWRPGVLLRALGGPAAGELSEVLTRDGPFGEAIEQHRGLLRRSRGQTLRLSRRTVGAAELRPLDERLAAIDATLTALRRYEAHGLGSADPSALGLRQEAEAAADRWQALYETGLPEPPQRGPAQSGTAGPGGPGTAATS